MGVSVKIKTQEFRISFVTAKKRRKHRENVEFELMEDLDNEPVKNEPKIISGLSKKAKKRAKKRMNLKNSALNDVMMDEMVTTKQSKTLSQGWHKVTLPNAGKFDKDIVLTSLANGCT